MCYFLYADINECMTGSDNCHTNAQCTDTEGSFTCSCNAGYTGDGVTCTSKIDVSLLYMMWAYMNVIIAFPVCIQMSSNPYSWSCSDRVPVGWILIS